jgi:hypothetical protein
MAEVQYSTSRLDEAVSSIAVLMDSPDEARTRAEVVARQLGPSVIPVLAGRFHSPPRPEPAGWSQEGRLGAWLSAWQFALFELFIQFGAPAVPVVRQTAFGEYDWTQSYAVEALARMAARGVDRETIVADLEREFGGLRFEVQLYVVEILQHHAQTDRAVAEIITELERIPAWRETLDDTFDDYED